MIETHIMISAGIEPQPDAARCQLGLEAVNQVTGLNISVAMLVLYEAPNYLRSFAFSISDDEEIQQLILAINQSKDKKIIASQIQEEAGCESKEGHFKSYFTDANQLSTLVLLEHNWLKKEGYFIDEAYFFAIPFVDKNAPEGVFFVFAKEEKEAEKLRYYLPEISMKIRSLF